MPSSTRCGLNGLHRVRSAYMYTRINCQSRHVWDSHKASLQQVYKSLSMSGVLCGRYALGLVKGPIMWEKGRLKRRALLRT